jgi:hypothetical protein
MKKNKSSYRVTVELPEAYEFSNGTDVAVDGTQLQVLSLTIELLIASAKKNSTPGQQYTLIYFHFSLPVKADYNVIWGKWDAI